MSKAAHTSNGIASGWLVPLRGRVTMPWKTVRKSDQTGGKANASPDIRESPSLLPLFHCYGRRAKLGGRGKTGLGHGVHRGATRQDGTGPWLSRRSLDAHPTGG